MRPTIADVAARIGLGKPDPACKHDYRIRGMPTRYDLRSPAYAVKTACQRCGEVRYPACRMWTDTVRAVSAAARPELGPRPQEE